MLTQSLSSWVLVVMLSGATGCGEPAPMIPPEPFVAVSDDEPSMRFEDLVLEGGSPGNYLPKYLPKAPDGERAGKPAVGDESTGSHAERPVEVRAPVLIRGEDAALERQLMDMMLPDRGALRIGEPLSEGESVAAEDGQTPLLVVAPGEAGPRFWWRGEARDRDGTERAIEAWVAGRDPVPEIALSFRDVSPSDALAAFELLGGLECRAIRVVR